MKRLQGSVMVEALIALVIVSVGVISVSSLQTSSLRMTRSAGDRTRAYFLANDLFEKIRAHPDYLTKFNMTSTAQLTGTCGGFSTGVSSTPCATADEAVTAMVGSWQKRVAANLPGGYGLVCKTSNVESGTVSAPDCDGSGGYVIKIWFTDFSVDSKSVVASTDADASRISLKLPYD